MRQDWEAMETARLLFAVARWKFYDICLPVAAAAVVAIHGIDEASFLSGLAVATSLLLYAFSCLEYIDGPRSIPRKSPSRLTFDGSRVRCSGWGISSVGIVKNPKVLAQWFACEGRKNMWTSTFFSFFLLLGSLRFMSYGPFFNRLLVHSLGLFCLSPRSTEHEARFQWRRAEWRTKPEVKGTTE